MRRLLAALAAVCVLAPVAAVVAAAPAGAGSQSGPPSAAGFYGYCNMNDYVLNSGTSSSISRIRMICNVDPTANATPGVQIQFYYPTLSTSTPATNGFGGNITCYNNSSFAALANCDTSPSFPLYGGWGLSSGTGSFAPGTTPTLWQSTGVAGQYKFDWTVNHVDDTARCTCQWDSSSTPDTTNYTYKVAATNGRTAQTRATHIHWTGAVAGGADIGFPAVPADYFTSSQAPPPPVVPCTVTWDAPSAVSWNLPHTTSGPWMFAGRVVTFSIHLDDLTRYVAVDVGARRISDFFGNDTPAPPTPPTPDPNFVSARSTTLAHDMTLQVTLPFDGIYNYQFRCQTVTGGITNEIGGTLSNLAVWPADAVISLCIPVIGVETCGQRPGLADCIPSSSGGLFGILGTALDPNTYVRATVCIAEALFMPGQTTIDALQHLWTLAQSRAPFSYIYDALTFLPSALTSFSSGLSGSGGCLINIPGAGCASIGTSSDLSLVRGVLLFLFVGLLTLAVIRTTMRVANGG